MAGAEGSTPGEVTVAYRSSNVAGVGAWRSEGWGDRQGPGHQGL